MYIYIDKYKNKRENTQTHTHIYKHSFLHTNSQPHAKRNDRGDAKAFQQLQKRELLTRCNKCTCVEVYVMQKKPRTRKQIKNNNN